MNASPLGLGPLVDEAGALQTPWLGLFGDLDKGIPVADVETLRGAVATATSSPNEIVRYAEADHGFHCNARGAYHEDSARDAWAACFGLVRHASRLNGHSPRANLYLLLGRGHRTRGPA